VRNFWTPSSCLFTSSFLMSLLFSVDELVIGSPDTRETQALQP
jgi:hypothetical protein